MLRPIGYGNGDGYGDGDGYGELIHERRQICNTQRR